MFRQSPAAFAFVFALVSCDGYPSAPSTGPVKLIPASISLTPLDGHLNRADSLELHARVLTDKSVEITDAVIQWSSDDAGIAMVNSNGVVYGLRQGATRINARIGSLFTQVPVVVADPFKDVPAFLGLDVPQVMLSGEMALLTGRVYNRFRERLFDSLVVWTSADTTIALASATGQVRAIKPGTAVMRARSGALTDSVSLLVVGPLPIRLDGTRVFVPESQALMRVLQPSPHGTTSVLLGVTWSSSDAAIATVDQQGVVTAHSQGSVIIGASTDSGFVSTPITVRTLPGRVIYGSAGHIVSLALDGRDATEIAIESSRLPTNPVLSFDGKELAFECADVCRVSLDSARLVPIRVGPGSQPSLSSDGSALLGRIDLLKYVVYRRSGAPLELAHHIYGGRPQLSPEGSRVLFECSYSDPYDDAADICIIETDGLAYVFRPSALRPAWAPDGLSVAYDAGFGVCVSPIARVECTWVNAYADAQHRGAATPAWSPDGKHLVIATGDELWLVDKNGDNLVRLPKATSVNSNPSWGAWAGVHP
jgi:hypothetical protein